MSRDKPTPGPWYVHTLNGRKVPRSLLLITTAEDQPIAVVVARLGETVANGRLMAAAPDVVAALERMIPLAERWARLRPEHHPDRVALTKARAALHKARHGNGEQEEGI